MGRGTVLLVVGTSLLIVLASVGALAPVLAPFDPDASVGPSLSAPSGHHLLGTNGLGQDVMSRLLYGARSSLTAATTAAVIALAVGTLVGTTAGLAGGVLDIVAMRVVDVMLAVPTLPLLVVIAGFARASTLTVTLLMAMLLWPPTARVLRAQTRLVASTDFVLAARSIGIGRARLVRHHLLPAMAPVVVAELVRTTGVAVFMDAGLAFLGLGDPVRVSWGLDLNRALAEPGIYITTAWRWLIVPSGLAISIAVLSLTLIGAGADPTFNPRLRRRS
jgi:ABC-type dipeptide/oligopeptide/nickel transport system permease subunit